MIPLDIGWNLVSNIYCERNIRHMKRKNFMMIISFVLLAILFSLSVNAYVNVSASSSGASAVASSVYPIALYARATIHNLLDQVNVTDEGVKYNAAASVSASQLYDVGRYPPTNSYAAASVGNFEDIWDSWPD